MTSEWVETTRGSGVKEQGVEKSESWRKKVLGTLPISSLRAPPMMRACEQSSFPPLCRRLLPPTNPVPLESAPGASRACLTLVVDLVFADWRGYWRPRAGSLSASPSRSRPTAAKKCGAGNSELIVPWWRTSDSEQKRYHCSGYCKYISEPQDSVVSLFLHRM